MANPRFADCALGLAAALISACTSNPAASNPAEMIELPIPAEELRAEWQVGFQDANELEQITEIVRTEESVESWTEMVTVQALKRSIGLPPIDEMLGAYRVELGRRHPGSTVTVIREEPDSIVYETLVKGGVGGPDERNVSRIVEGQWNRFWLTYAVRAPVAMTAERRTEWIDRLVGAAVHVIE